MTRQTEYIRLHIDKVLDLTATARISCAIKAMHPKEEDEFLLDLKDTREIRESGLAMLLMIKRLTADMCIKVRLINCNEDIINRLSHAGFTRHFCVN